MKHYMIATNWEGCVFGNYFTEIMTEEEAEKKLEQVQQADPNAKLVVIRKEETINADKESS